MAPLRSTASRPRSIQTLPRCLKKVQFTAKSKCVGASKVAKPTLVALYCARSPSRASPLRDFNFACSTIAPALVTDPAVDGADRTPKPLDATVVGQLRSLMGDVVTSGDRTRVLRLKLRGAEAPVWDLARTPLTGLGGSPSAGG